MFSSINYDIYLYRPVFLTDSSEASDHLWWVGGQVSYSYDHENNWKTKIFRIKPKHRLWAKINLIFIDSDPTKIDKKILLSQSKNKKQNVLPFLPSALTFKSADHIHLVWIPLFPKSIFTKNYLQTTMDLWYNVPVLYICF